MQEELRCGVRLVRSGACLAAPLLPLLCLRYGLSSIIFDLCMTLSQ